ncbi:LOW QUALITY PROTEIN: beta-1,4-galactosyltransferase 1 [Dryobates pubescens]|uniref:LOW QUALITY PROTEIN: beta-1,4-galactosyltransferase 1 n=1 Tax=Dryobates pubescens TaxID=118200 RepID=UPI0023B98FCC|nr:LOW QUALITY PROTEIN: beta-1,4-galactosyltransferase 1 [Dryobates pubescens]
MPRQDAEEEAGRDGMLDRAGEGGPAGAPCRGGSRRCPEALPGGASGLKESSLPGTSLQRACRLLVAFCALHLSATLLYYLAGSALGPPGNPEPPPRRLPPANLSLPFSRPPLPSAARPRPRFVGSSSGLCPEPSPLLGVCPRGAGVTAAWLSTRADGDCGRIAGELGVDGAAEARMLSQGRSRRPSRDPLPGAECSLPVRLGFFLVAGEDGEEEFNRAKLLNIGFTEALKEYDYDCFVFSDVDLIPMDDRNTYKCYSQPRHLSVSMDKFGFRLPYNQYFGGVSALSKEQFTKINGFPNNYWGWGGEDDDIYNRLVFKGMGISRPDAVVGKCRMIRHSRDRKNEPNPERFDRIAHTRETMNSDGLNTLSYKVLRTDKYPLYTKITVMIWDIGSPKSSHQTHSSRDLAYVASRTPGLTDAF